MKIVFVDGGFDIYLHKAWYGVHFYWQSSPLFDIINSHTKMDTVHKYGFIFLGLWCYLRIDE